MISGVRASSIKMLSASSTMAYAVGALHRHLALVVAPASQIDLLECLAMSVASELQLFQLVAQKVEAKLFGSSIGDVAGVGLTAFGVALASLDAADRQPQ